MMSSSVQNSLFRKLWDRQDRWMLPLLAAFFACPLFAAFVDPWLALYLGSYKHHWIVKSAQWATDFGNAWPYLVGIAVLFAGSYLFRNAKSFRAKCLYVFVTICAAGALSEVIAIVIGRSRPRLLLEQGIYSLSFLSGFKPYDSMPSSHATSVLAFAFATAIVMPQMRKLLFAYGFVLATTRVLINAHYAGDILASAAVTAATALFLQRYLPQQGDTSVQRVIAKSPSS